MKNLFKIIRLWPELWSVPLALAIFHFSPMLLRHIDPMAATFDAGVLQNIVFAVVAILVFSGASFMGIKLNFPLLYEYYEKLSGESFLKLSEKSKVIILLCVYFGFLFAFVLAFKVI